MSPTRVLIRVVVASSLFLLLPIVATAATTEIRVMFDVDNDATTGCAVGGMDGVEQVLVTQVAEGIDSMNVAQTHRLECVGGVLGAPTDVTGGWPAGWISDSKLMTVETRISFAAVGEGRPTDLRVGFDATRNGFTHTAMAHTDGTEIMVPPPPSSRRRSIRFPGSSQRVIVLDGAMLDWGTIAPILTGVAGGGSPTLRINDVFFFGNPVDQWLYFGISLKIGSDDPFADDDTFFRDPGEPITVDPPGVLDNDGDPNGQPLTALKVSEPDKGTVTLNPDGSFTYTPNTPDQNATDDFKYRATNGARDSNVATVRIKVDQGEGPKQPADDAYSTPEDVNLIVPDPGVLDNDPKGTKLVAKLVSGPTHGVLLSFSPDGGFTYKPNSNYFGTDSFVYTVEKENQASIVGNATGGNATVTITIISVNDAPKVKDATFSLNENSPAGTVVGTVEWSDDDAADTHNVSIISGNTNNAFDIDDDGVITVDNAAAIDFEVNPTFSLTVRVRDDGDPQRSDTGTITINLIDQNDPPIVTLGGTTSITYTENDPPTVINGTLTVTDPESGPIAGATVQISANFAAGQDVLSFTPVGAITGSFVGNTLTLSGSDSAANYQTALRSVRYENTSDDPSTAARTITWIVNDGTSPSAPVTNTVNVVAVNDAPVNAVPAAQSTDEDTPLTFSAGDGNAISISDVDGSSSQVTLVATNGTLTASAGATIANNGTASVQLGGANADINTSLEGLVFTPTANYNGPAQITITTNDQGNTGTGGAQSDVDVVAITVNAVNDPPTFNLGGDQIVNEDAGLQTVNGFASSISVGPPDESAQTISSFNVTNDNNALFSQQPAIDTSGNLTYQTNADLNGVATVTVTATDSGGATSSPAQTFTITVNAVNDEPTFAIPADPPASNEDAGPQTVNGLATSISMGPADESGQTVVGFALTPTGTTGDLTFSAGPAIDASGNLTYTATADTNGTASFDVVLTDSGSNVAPNDNTSPTVSFTITVNAVNDPPTFNLGADQIVNEDAGLQTVNGFVTSISVGPSNESAQSITSFNMSNDNNALFLQQPAIDTSGNLTYQTNADLNGTATVSVTATDSGGATSSPAQTFLITVNAVNDEPTFSIPTDPPASNEDGGLQTVNGLATSISAGPADESAQTLSFGLTPNGSTGTLTFSSGPAIDSSGNLTYTATADTNGTATFDVVLTDSGSNIAPNDNTSATLSFTITVNAVNDPPTFNLGGNQTVNEDAGLQTVNGFASSISVGPSDENAQTITSFNVTNDNNALFSGQPAIDTSGNLTYTPAGNAFGSALVSVTATDSGGATSSPAQTFTITVNPVNDNPEVTAGGTLNYTENQAATAIDTTITITDVDSGMLTGATVQITANYVEGEDILSFVDAAPITGSFDGPSGTLTLTGTDTLANYQTALRAVMYNNTSDDPSTLARTVTWQVNDGAGVNNLSLPVTSTINVAAVNDAPIVDAVATFGYTEGDGAVAIDPALNLSDPDDTQMSGATITISANYAAGEDVLSFTPVGSITGVFAAGVLTLSNTDSIANYQTALRSVTYNNTSSSPSVMPRTITWSVSDMALLPGTDTTTINITAVNSAPVLGTSQITPTIYTENSAPVQVDATITVSDADTTNLVGATVTLTTNYDNGADSLQFVDAPPITGVWNAGTGTLTLSGSDSVANYQTALRSVTFETTGDDPSGAVRTVEWQVDDGEPVDNLSNVLQTAVDVAPVNDPPTIDATGPLAYTEDDGAVIIDNSVIVADLDDVNLTTATVQITGNFASGQDVLAYPGGFGITGGFVGDTLTLTGPASPANFQSALRTVTYQNTSQNPSTLQRTLTWTVNDDEPSSGTDTTNIDVTAVNDAPVLSVTGTLNYTENGAAAALLSSANITDADDTNIESATIVISGNYVNGEDVLSYADVAPIMGTWTPGTATLTLTGSDSLADYITALQSVMYANTSDAPSELQRTITWTVNDGTANSTTSPTSVVNVTAVNDPPVITHPASITVNEDAIFSFTGGDAVSVADPDSGASNIQFTVGPGGTFPDGTVCVGAPVSNCFTATFTITLPLASVNSALAAMTFQPAANVTAADTIPFQVNDQGNTGTGGSLLDNETTNVTITPINDAPALSVTGTLNYTENGAAANLLTSANITDVDDVNIESATIQITGNYQTGADVLSYVDVAPIAGVWVAASGTLTLTGSDSLADYITALQSVQYANTSENPSGLQRTVTWTVNDGDTNSNQPTSTVNVTPVNDPPAINANDLAYAEDDGPVAIDGALTLTDPDDPNTITGATVEISANFVGGEDILAFTNTAEITGNFVGDTLTLTGTTTVANYQAALRSVTYENTSQTPSTAPRTITWTVDDDEPSSGTDTTTITVTATNDAPVLSVTGSLNPYTEGDAATPLGVTVTITDVDDTDMESAQIVITGNFQSGADVLAFTNQNGINGTWTAGTGTLDLLGTSSKANYVTALQSITFQNTSENPSTAQRTITFTVNDGDDPSNSDTSTVDVVAVNDPPINSLPTNPQSVDEDTALFFTGAGNVISVSDADVNAGNLTVQIITTNGTTTVVTPGVVVFGGGGNGTANYTITGTQAQVNSALGSLRFDPTLNFPGAAPSGIATIQIVSNDNGNTPAPAQQDDDTFNITVNQVNDPPVGGGDSAETVGNVQLFYDVTPGVGEFGTTKTTAGAADGVLDNDSDPVEGSAVSVAGIVGCADGTAPFDCATVNGGQITMNTNGTFTFRPKDDSVAADSFQYILTDGTPADNVNVTVNLTFVGNPIFFVKNDAATGGLGRSHDPFDTLAEAQTAANTAGDRVFVYFGDGNTTGQNAGFTFQAANQILQGEAIALTTGTTVNGVNNATLVAAGSQPLIGNAAGNGVTIGTNVGTTIRGLSIGGSADAINLTTAVAATGTTTITNNTIRSAGTNGVDININAGASGTATLVFTNNTWTASTGNGFDVDVNAAALQLNFSNNSLVAGGTAVNIDGTGGGTTTITGFADNTISGNTVGSGVTINTATFDATPGGGFNLVDGNNLAVGASGNPVNAAGMVLTNVQGNLFFDDLDIFAAVGTGLGITGTGGGMTFAVTANTLGGTSTIDADNGAAVSINTVALDLRLSDLESDTSVSGVSLNSVSGQFSAPAGSAISKTSGAGTAFSVASSSVTVDYAGSLNVTSGAGVALTTNTGTMTFRGGMTLSTGTNTAFSASGGGTVNVCDESPCSNAATGALINTLTTTTGTALSVNGTNIGTNNLEFRSINAGGAASAPANGIFLNNTGSAGGLKVKGNGGTCTFATPTCTGGTIQSATANAVHLVNTQHVSLTRMRIHDNDTNGIYGDELTNLAVDTCVVSDNDVTNVSAFEAGIKFNELYGTNTISNTVVRGTKGDNIRIEMSSGILNNLTVSNSTIGPTANVGGGYSNGFSIVTTGSPTLTVTANNCLFTGVDSAKQQSSGLLTSIGGGTTTLTVTDNTFEHENIAIDLGASSTGTHKFNVDNNDVFHHRTNAINIIGASTLDGTVNNNVVGNGSADSGSMNSFGIALSQRGSANVKIAITNNDIQNTDFEGIFVRTGDLLAGDNGRTDLTLSGNDVAVPDDNSGFPANPKGMHLRSRQNTTLCMNISNNEAQGNGAAGYHLQESDSSSLSFEGFNTNAVTTLTNKGNTTGGGAPTTNEVGAPFAGACTAALPTFP